MSLLELSGVTGGYGPVTVLRGIDLTVDEGEVVVVLGANGAGKTTTLRAITGEIATRGQVLLDGRPLARSPEKAARAGVGRTTVSRVVNGSDLVSDEARGINGAVWMVDHGFSATAEGQLRQRVSLISA